MQNLFYNEEILGEQSQRGEGRVNAGYREVSVLKERRKLQPTPTSCLCSPDTI